MDLDTLLMTEVCLQADIEYCHVNIPDQTHDILVRLESYIRNQIFHFRHSGTQMTVVEMMKFLKSSAEKFNFENPDIMYCTKMVEHGVPLLIYEFTFGTINGFIKVVSL